MATLSEAPHSFIVDENLMPAANDPYQQSTPRTTAQDNADLMKVLQQVVPQSPATEQKRVSQAAAIARRPQCTHMNMIRLHGAYRCHGCGKVPQMGFVYRCQEDHIQQCYSDYTTPESLPVVPDHGDFFEAQARIAEELDMSQSVIHQMQAGEYSYEQIEILFSQRRRVIECVARDRANDSSLMTMQDNSIRSLNRTSSVYSPTESIIASIGASPPPTALAAHQLARHGVSGPLILLPPETPSNAAADTSSTTPSKKYSKKATCNFQVCHSCRPYFRDRVPMSVEAVLNNEVPALTTEETKTLPVMSANILRDLKFHANVERLSPPPPPLENVGTAFDPADFDMDNQDRNIDTDTSPPSSASGSEAGSTIDMRNTMPCPGAGICPLWTTSAGCAYDYGYDDGQRAMNHGFAHGRDYALDGTPHRNESSFHLPIIVTDSGDATSIPPSMIDTPSFTTTTGSSVSLPDSLNMLLSPYSKSELSANDSPMGSKPGKAASVCGVLRDDQKALYSLRGRRILSKESTSSLGSEVEVEGGVALTEEAVESGMPDIGTDNE